MKIIVHSAKDEIHTTFVYDRKNICFKSTLIICLIPKIRGLLPNVINTLNCSCQLKQPLISGAQPDVFQGREDFVKLVHFDKDFLKNSRRKNPAGENSGVFSPRHS